MTLKTWKKIYYPVEANVPKTDADALKHSLLKWQGLRPAAMQSHGVELNPLYALWLTDDTDDESLRLSSGTCALCQLHVHNRCTSCPLYAVRSVACDILEDAPWRVFVSDHDPEPMITLIEQALKAAS